MGDVEGRARALLESAVGYHPGTTGILTYSRGAGVGTMAGGQFDWGGRLLKGNGGAQRLPQRGRESRGRVQRQKVA